MQCFLVAVINILFIFSTYILVTILHTQIPYSSVIATYINHETTKTISGCIKPSNREHYALHVPSWAQTLVYLAMKFITIILILITYSLKVAWNHHEQLALLDMLIIKTCFLDRMMLSLSLPTVHQPSITFNRRDIKFLFYFTNNQISVSSNITFSAI
jgi:hypothetical protein